MTTGPTLTVALADTAPDLPPDARQLLGALHWFALDHTAADPASKVPAPTSRTVRRAYLPAWSRTRYAAALRVLIDAGLYRAARGDGWNVLVTIPKPKPQALR